MFSIIIPLYNKAAYIKNAICSIANQSFKEFELIIIDDGSTDNPLPPEAGTIEQRLFFLDDINSIKDKIQIIRQHNKGVSVARNNGVKLARYDYITFLDADDWWESSFLLKMRDLINDFPEVGIYGCSYYIVKDNIARTAPLGLDPDFKEGVINYFSVYAKTLCMPLTSISVVIPKSVFENENGFKPSIKQGEDFDLWVRIAAKYPVIFLNIPLAYYNQDVNSEERGVNSKLYEVDENMLFTDYGKLIQNPEFRNLFEKLFLYGVIQYYLTGKNKKVVNSILSSINWSQHEFKYRLYYVILPKWLVKCWFSFLKLGSKVKTILRRIR